MKRKDLIKLIESFPEEITSEDVISRLLFIEQVKEGLNASENDDVQSHELVKAKLNEWQQLNGQTQQ